MLDVLSVFTARLFQRNHRSDCIVDKLRRVRLITEHTNSDDGLKHLIKAASRVRELPAANYLWNREYQQELLRRQSVFNMLGESAGSIRPGDSSVRSSCYRKGF